MVINQRQPWHTLFKERQNPENKCKRVYVVQSSKLRAFGVCGTLSMDNYKRSHIKLKNVKYTSILEIGHSHVSRKLVQISYKIKKLKMMY